MTYNIDMKPEQDPSLNADWFLTAVQSLRIMQEQINQLATGHIDRRAFTGVIRPVLEGLFAYSSYGFFIASDPGQSRLEPVEGFPIQSLEGSLLRQVKDSHEPFFSDEQPPTLVLPEQRAMVCCPLNHQNNLLGVLMIRNSQRTAFTAIEKHVILQLAAQITGGLILMQAESGLQKDLARKDEELANLRRASLLISSRLQLEETLEAILQMALEMTSARYGIFRLMDRSGQTLVTRAFAGESLARPLVEALPVDGHTVTGLVARTRQPICIADLRADEWRKIYYPLDALTEMRSELAVPLINASGRLEGVLNLESPLVAGFSEQDSHMLQSLATQAVIAIEEARLMDAVQEIAQHLLLKSDARALQRIMEIACDLLSADVSALWTIVDGKLSLQAFSGCCHPHEVLDLEESLIGKALNSRSVQVLRSGTSDRGAGWTGITEPADALMVSLSSAKGSPHAGVLVAYSLCNETSHLTDSDWNKKVITFLAQYAALSIQNAARQEALRAAQEQHAVAETFAAVGDVAANVLHNLNNKVGTIPVRVQGIRGKRKQILEDDAYLSSNLTEIERSANEAMQSVRENLSHLRPIVLDSVDVASCVSAAVQAAHLPDGVQVHVSGLKSLPKVKAAAPGLTLVFTNLLGNAAEAMRGQGQIAITGRALEDGVEIRVADDGPGIPPEIQSRIFELNYSGSRSASGAKLGFGLWWVKTLMVRLSGSVAVTSDGLHGAVFTVNLPVGKP